MAANEAGYGSFCSVSGFFVVDSGIISEDGALLGVSCSLALL